MSLEALVHRVTRTWRAEAPHLWWGDAVDARFLVADALRGLHNVRVLDIGCGAGVLLSEAAATNIRVGIDHSIEAVHLAGRLEPSLRLCRADMLALPFQDAAFDVVVFCGMLEVPQREEKAHAVRELARVLRPGGRVLLTTPNRRYPRYRRHDLMVTYEELQAVLRPYFDVQIRGFNPFPPFPYFLPNKVLARVPGIWRILVGLMERGIGTRSGCSFLVKAVKRSDERMAPPKMDGYAEVRACAR